MIQGDVERNRDNDGDSAKTTTPKRAKHSYRISSSERLMVVSRRHGRSSAIPENGHARDRARERERERESERESERGREGEEAVKLQHRRKQPYGHMSIQTFFCITRHVRADGKGHKAVQRQTGVSTARARKQQHQLQARYS